MPRKHFTPKNSATRSSESNYQDALDMLREAFVGSAMATPERLQKPRVVLAMAKGSEGPDDFEKLARKEERRSKDFKPIGADEPIDDAEIAGPPEATASPSEKNIPEPKNIAHEAVVERLEETLSVSKDKNASEALERVLGTTKPEGPESKEERNMRFAKEIASVKNYQPEAMGKAVEDITELLREENGELSLEVKKEIADIREKAMRLVVERQNEERAKKEAATAAKSEPAPRAADTIRPAPSRPSIRPESPILDTEGNIIEEEGKTSASPPPPKGPTSSGGPSSGTPKQPASPRTSPNEKIVDAWQKELDTFSASEKKAREEAGSILGKWQEGINKFGPETKTAEETGIKGPGARSEEFKDSMRTAREKLEAAKGEMDPAQYEDLKNKYDSILAAMAGAAAGAGVAKAAETRAPGTFRAGDSVIWHTMIPEGPNDVDVKIHSVRPDGTIIIEGPFGQKEASPGELTFIKAAEAASAAAVGAPGPEAAGATAGAGVPPTPEENKEQISPLESARAAYVRADAKAREAMNKATPGATPDPTLGTAADNARKEYARLLGESLAKERTPLLDTRLAAFAQEKYAGDVSKIPAAEKDKLTELVRRETAAGEALLLLDERTKAHLETRREKMSASGAFAESAQKAWEKAIKVGDWYRKLPLKAKLAVSAGLMGAGVASFAVGGTVGAALGAGALGGRVIYRGLGGLGLAGATEAVIQKKQEKGFRKSIEANLAGDLEKFLNNDAAKLNQKIEQLEGKRGHQKVFRYIAASAAGLFVALGGVGKGISYTSEHTGASSAVRESFGKGMRYLSESSFGKTVRESLGKLVPSDADLDKIIGQPHGGGASSSLAEETHASLSRTDESIRRAGEALDHARATLGGMQPEPIHPPTVETPFDHSSSHVPRMAEAFPHPAEEAVAGAHAEVPPAAPTPEGPGATPEPHGTGLETPHPAEEAISGAKPTVPGAEAAASKPEAKELITRAIGRRGPEGAMVDYFKENPDAAKKFGWDGTGGKRALKEWAGARAHQLWLEEAKGALANPETAAEMKRLGYPQNPEGYAKMMHHIGKGALEINPDTHQIELRDMKYIKAHTALPVEPAEHAPKHVSLKGNLAAGEAPSSARDIAREAAERAAGTPTLEQELAQASAHPDTFLDQFSQHSPSDQTTLIGNLESAIQHMRAEIPHTTNPTALEMKRTLLAQAQTMLERAERWTALQSEWVTKSGLSEPQLREVMDKWNVKQFLLADKKIQSNGMLRGPLEWALGTHRMSVHELAASLRAKTLDPSLKIGEALKEMATRP